MAKLMLGGREVTPMIYSGADRSLSNLNSEGESHFCNPALTNSPYTTNRILEIPQDIKLELNSGTLTLKAGSKLYYPDGFESDGTTPKFSEYIVSTDYSFTGGDYGFTGIHILVFGKNSSGIYSHAEPDVTICYSGTTAPTNFGQYAYWWDLSTNQFKWTINSGSTWYLFDTGLPVALFHYSGTDYTITSIDQVFNGFGYIGSTVFALPNVKVQIPNGRNEDGTCKSRFYIVDVVKTNTVSNANTLLHSYIGDLSQYGGTPYDFFCAADSLTKNTDANLYLDTATGKYNSWCPVLSLSTDANGKINNDFQLSVVDSVANSNASNFSKAGRSYLSGLGMPTTSGINLLTNGAFNSTVTSTEQAWTSPYTGWVYAQNITSTGIFVRCDSISTVAGTGNGANRRVFVPVVKGKTIQITTGASGGSTTLNALVLFYSKGEV